MRPSTNTPPMPARWPGAIPQLALARVALVVASLAAGARAQAEPAWEVDLETALVKAHAAGKDLLVDFTGSDWCGWCIKLDDEVFEQDAFAAYAREHLVLVELDFPRRGGPTWRAQPERLRHRNAAHAKRYDVRGYPTVLLMSPEGVVYARTGYQRGGAAAYVEHLRSLRAGPARRELAERLQRLRSADAEREERAALAYELLDEAGGPFRAELVALLGQLDPADPEGRCARAAIDLFAAQHLAVADPDWDAVARGLDELVRRTPSAERVGRYHMLRGFCHAMRDELPGAEQCLERVRELGDEPERSAAELERVIASRRAQGPQD